MQQWIVGQCPGGQCPGAKVAKGRGGGGGACGKRQPPMSGLAVILDGMPNRGGGVRLRSMLTSELHKITYKTAAEIKKTNHLQNKA